MNKLQLKTNPKVELVFENYPDTIRDKMFLLRNLIIESAKELDEITCLQETLKWNEPSYLTKLGSTIRIDWKPKYPYQHAMYFSCQSRLVQTFKLVAKTTFKYEAKRAIIFQLDEEIPKEELKYLIKAALIYHKVKHLPTLGL